MRFDGRGSSETEKFFGRFVAGSFIVLARLIHSIFLSIFVFTLSLADHF